MDCKLPNKYTSKVDIFITMSTVIITILLTGNSKRFLNNFYLKYLHCIYNKIFLNNYLIALDWLVFLINPNKISFLIHGHFPKKEQEWKKKKQTNKDGEGKGKEEKRWQGKKHSFVQQIFNRSILRVWHM